MREILAHIALAHRESDRGRSQAAALVGLAEQVGSSRQRAIADYVIGRAELLEGNPREGKRHLSEALTVFASLGVERGVADVLDELALLVAAQEPVRCARLAAAASMARNRLSCAALPETTRRLDAARRQILEQGEAEMWDRGWMEGAAMSLNDAVNYARNGREARAAIPAQAGGV